MGLLLEKNCLIVRCEKTVLQIRAVHVTGDLALMSCRISTRRGLAGSWLAISNSGSKLRISLSTMSGKVHCPLAACVGQYLLSLILTFFFHVYPAVMGGPPSSGIKWLDDDKWIRREITFDETIPSRWRIVRKIHEREILHLEWEVKKRDWRAEGRGVFLCSNTHGKKAVVKVRLQ